MITPQEALQRTIEHREVFHDEMLHIVRLIMSGECSPVMMAALITGLRVKKETIGEITAAAQVMREVSTKVAVADTTNLVDIVGTGGDGSHTFNISTCSMFVAAAAGAKVSKHGGRSVSGKSGSADVLESLGVNINLKPEQIARLGNNHVIYPSFDRATYVRLILSICDRYVSEIQESSGVRFVLDASVYAQIYANAYQPLSENRITFEQALDIGSKPLKTFMLKQVREPDVELFMRLSNTPKVASQEELPMRVVVPAYVTSELKTAFQIGFIVFIPFIIIDMVVASVLMSMGMMMMSPVIVSLPFKLMLFVLVDGWNLILGTLVSSFGQI